MYVNELLSKELTNVSNVCDLLLIRKAVVQHLIQSFQRSSGSALAKTFRVNYKRHVLTMDDLGTLYGQNWLNDQVKQYGTIR